MRIRLALGATLILAAACARTNEHALGSLYRDHRWFELRTAVAAGRAPAFYRGAVECAFRDLPRCEATLQSVIGSAPRGEQAVDAHRILVSAYLREGFYSRALAEADALLAVRPDDPDTKGDRPLLQALGRHPDQQVVGRRSGMLRLEDHGLRVVVDGRPATYWFDTGANLSVISASEATRLGLSVADVASRAGVMTGAAVRFRVALADEIQVGAVRVRHVAFLVFPDDQQPFDTLPEGSRGLIGMPVLLALGRFSVGVDRRFEIAPEAAGSGAAPNLCFDGKNPVVRVGYAGRPLAFTLDTGASTTDLYPPFARAYPDLVRGGTRQSRPMRGVGSTAAVDSVVLPQLELRLGTVTVALRPATVLLEQTGESSRFFQGNLGIDLLLQPRRTTLDFGAMTLVAE